MKNALAHRTKSTDFSLDEHVNGQCTDGERIAIAVKKLTCVFFTVTLSGLTDTRDSSFPRLQSKSLLSMQDDTQEHWKVQH